MKIIYSKKGKAISDFEAFNVLCEHITKDEDLYISTSNILTLCNFLPKVGSEFKVEIINEYIENLAHIPKHLDKPTSSITTMMRETRDSLDFLKRNLNIMQSKHLTSRDYEELSYIRAADKTIMSLFYTTNCKPFSDFEIEKVFWEHYLSGKNIKTCNQTMLEYIRYMHALGFIDSLSISLNSDVVRYHYGIRCYNGKEKVGDAVPWYDNNNVDNNKDTIKFLDYHVDDIIMHTITAALKFHSLKKSEYTLGELKEYLQDTTDLLSKGNL